jgi:adenosylcobyric acid synthase
MFNSYKTTTQVKARVAADDGLFKGLKDIDIIGYEIHMGQTGNYSCPPALHVLETPQGKTDYFDGAISQSGLIFGTYIHGLFHNAEFTNRLLNRLRHFRGLSSTASSPTNKQEMYDKLADVIRHSLDMSRVYDITLGRNHG